eukprot:4978413-Alexandrium_andersonii.AAC.1
MVMRARARVPEFALTLAFALSACVLALGSFPHAPQHDLLTALLRRIPQRPLLSTFLHRRPHEGLTQRRGIRRRQFCPSRPIVRCPNHALQDLTAASKGSLASQPGNEAPVADVTRCAQWAASMASKAFVHSSLHIHDWRGCSIVTLAPDRTQAFATCAAKSASSFPTLSASVGLKPSGLLGVRMLECERCKYQLENVVQGGPSAPRSIAAEEPLARSPLEELVA